MNADTGPLLVRTVSSFRRTLSIPTWEDVIAGSSARSDLDTIAAALKKRQLLVKDFHENSQANAPQKDCSQALANNLSQLLSSSKSLTRLMAHAPTAMTAEEGELFFRNQLLIEILQFEQRTFPDLHAKGYSCLAQAEEVVNTIKSLQGGAALLPPKPASAPPPIPTSRPAGAPRPLPTPPSARKKSPPPPPKRPPPTPPSDSLRKLACIQHSTPPPPLTPPASPEHHKRSLSFSLPIRKPTPPASPVTARGRNLSFSAGRGSSPIQGGVQVLPSTSEEDQLCELLQGLHVSRPRTFKQISQDRLASKVGDLICETHTLLLGVLSTQHKDDFETRIKRAESLLIEIQSSSFYHQKSQSPVGGSNLLAVSLAVYQHRLHAVRTLLSDDMVPISKTCSEILRSLSKSSPSSDRDNMKAIHSLCQQCDKAFQLLQRFQDSHPEYSRLACKIIEEKLKFFNALIEKRISSIRISSLETAAAVSLDSEGKASDKALLFIEKSLLLDTVGGETDRVLVQKCLMRLGDNVPDRLQTLATTFVAKKTTPISSVDQKIVVLRRNIAVCKNPSWREAYNLLTQFLEISSLVNSDPRKMQESFLDLGRLVSQNKLLTQKKETLAQKILSSDEDASLLLGTRTTQPLPTVHNIFCPLCIEAFLGIERHNALIEQLPQLSERISVDFSADGNELKRALQEDTIVPFMILLYLAKKFNLQQSLLTVVSLDASPEQHKQFAHNLLPGYLWLSEKSPFLASLVSNWLQKNTLKTVLEMPLDEKTCLDLKSTLRTLSEIFLGETTYLDLMKKTLQSFVVTKDVNSYYAHRADFLSIEKNINVQMATLFPSEIFGQETQLPPELMAMFNAGEERFLLLEEAQNVVIAARGKLEERISEILSMESSQDIARRLRQKNVLDEILAQISTFPEEETRSRLRSATFDREEQHGNILKSQNPAQSFIHYYASLLIAISGPYKNNDKLLEGALLTSDRLTEEQKKQTPLFHQTMEKLRKVYSNLSLRPNGAQTELPLLQKTLGELFSLVTVKEQELDRDVSSGNTSFDGALTLLRKLQSIIPENASCLSEESIIQILTHASFASFVDNLALQLSMVPQDSADLIGRTQSTLMRCQVIIKQAINACATPTNRERLFEMHRLLRMKLNAFQSSLDS